MPRGVIPIRGSEAEHALWKEVAELEGKRFSAWARQVLTEEAERVKAEAGDRDMEKVEREVVLRQAFPHSKRSFTPDFK